MSTATAVRERPILFSGPMVRAILDGTKTQTRRVMLPQPSRVSVDHFRPISIVTATGAWEFQACAKGGGPVDAFPAGRDSVRSEVVCPYGAPGDRLWVRETLTLWPGHAEYAASEDGMSWVPESPELMAFLDSYSSATVPSIHMPRWASRLTLQVTDVRVERLQDISEEDARAEGVERHWDEGVWYYGPFNHGHASATVEFERLWDSINAKRGHGWDTNPWVWVVSFEKVGA